METLSMYNLQTPVPWTTESRSSSLNFHPRSSIHFKLPGTPISAMRVKILSRYKSACCNSWDNGPLPVKYWCNLSSSSRLVSSSSFASPLKLSSLAASLSISSMLLPPSNNTWSISSRSGPIDSRLYIDLGSNFSEKLIDSDFKDASEIASPSYSKSMLASSLLAKLQRCKSRLLNTLGFWIGKLLAANERKVAWNVLAADCQINFQWTMLSSLFSKYSGSAATSRDKESSFLVSLLAKILRNA